jgi:hypothetical protein
VRYWFALTPARGQETVFFSPAPLLPELCEGAGTKSIGFEFGIAALDLLRLAILTKQQRQI